MTATSSAITWKYPSCILAGDNSVGAFYSVAITNNLQQADTGTKAIHIATRSTIISKGISAGRGQNTYRGLVKVLPKAQNARNYTQVRLPADRREVRRLTRCRTLRSATRRARRARGDDGRMISDDQMFYCHQRGLSREERCRSSSMVSAKRC